MASLRATRKRKEQTKKGRKKDEEVEEDALIDYAGELSTGENTEDDFSEDETADAKRLRVAKAFLDKVKLQADKSVENFDEEEDLDGLRDSLVADRLQQKQNESSGRTLRALAKR